MQCHPDTGLHFKNQNSYFIYGGDVTDRGNRDLEITQLLIDFKKRHPENVFLIVGNREIKNNRFKIELDPLLIKERLLHSKPPRWISTQTVPLDYVLADMATNGKKVKADDIEAIQNYVSSLSTEKCQLLYLRWMLEKTMGCPHTFRYRREEIERLQPKKTITDEDVLKNFLNETSPDGLMGQYLQHAQVGVIIPDTGVLAVHGGISEFNVGRIPGMSPEEKPISDAALWIQKFNQWYAEQIKQWIALKPKTLTEPAFTKLDEIVLPIPGQHKSVITADMLNKERQFKEIPPSVGEYLKSNGMQIVLTGHQPCGDYPAVLRDDHQNILFINGDTGYAKIDPKNPDDTRGQASHTLEISATKDVAAIDIDATLSNGTKAITQLTTTSDGIVGDPYIGKILSDGNLVQCRLADGKYRLAQQKGFQVTYMELSEPELTKMLENKGARPPLS